MKKLHKMAGIRVAVALLGGTLSSWALTACSSDEKVALSKEGFCAQRGAAECDALATACALDPAARANCEASRAKTCLDQAARLEQAPGRVLQEGNAKKCLAETKRLFAGLMTAANWTALQQVCERTFEGMVQPGQACTIDIDCANNLICDKGACGPRKPVASGAGCSNAGEVCVAGQFCARQLTSQWLCVARAQANMPCDASVLCMENLRCSGGLCVAGLNVSESCTGEGQCASPNICEPIRSRCAEAVSPSQLCDGFSARDAAAPEAGAGL